MEEDYFAKLKKKLGMKEKPGKEEIARRRKMVDDYIEQWWDIHQDDTYGDDATMKRFDGSSKEELKEEFYTFADVEGYGGSVDLSFKRLGPEGMEFVAQLLPLTRSKRFSFPLNNIGDVGASILASGLNRASIREIALESNEIGDDGATAIVSALQDSSTLKKIEFDGNLIGDAGAESIADLVRHCSTLRVLGLNNNKIGDVGAKALASAISENKGLEEFMFLSGNEFGTVGRLALANALKLRKKMLFMDQDDSRVILKFELTVEKEIGRGQFGIALRAHHKDQNHDGPCVVKFAVGSESCESAYETLMLESIPEHPNLLKLLGKCIDFKYTVDEKEQDVPGLVVEWHGGGSLKSHVASRGGKLQIAEVFSLALQMTDGIAHIHKHKMVHRDIALRNFVLTDDKLNAILIDFGLSYIISQENEPFYTRPGEEIPAGRWAPECLGCRHPFFLSSDVWMLGLAFYQFQVPIANNKPFPLPLHQLGDYLFSVMVQKGKAVPLRGLARCHPLLRRLVEYCCAFDFLKRPKARDVVDFIKDLQQSVNADGHGSSEEGQLGDKQERVAEEVGDIEYAGYVSASDGEEEEDNVVLSGYGSVSDDEGEDENTVGGSYAGVGGLTSGTYTKFADSSPTADSKNERKSEENASVSDASASKEGDMKAEEKDSSADDAGVPDSYSVYVEVEDSTTESTVARETKAVKVNFTSKLQTYYSDEHDAKNFWTI